MPGHVTPNESVAFRVTALGAMPCSKEAAIAQNICETLSGTFLSESEAHSFDSPSACNRTFEIQH